ncbi:putative mitochondrial protein [Vitis vinifera]|uniref:Putative mitochondrial protein n=1 Tax=Vitis vinifera TaxID=29760 RepID=A0A438FR51_VITVI|nr:putative mitochondrial protein [Vitis vinifera]
MITRSQRGIIKPNPKYALTSTTNSTSIPREPHNIRAALAHPGWKAAMDEELQALHTNKTWVLVPRTSDMHVIGSKWVFKPKLKPDGSLDRLKARVVAKGYHQVDGLDYTETFSPVIKPGTIRMKTYTWNNLQEWLISNIQHMCASFKRLSMASNKHLVLDDILLTGSSTALVSTFIQRLSSEFAMKDLGQIHYFLGIEISQTADGLHLSQSHYALTILERANMVDCKPMSTPLEVKTKTSPNNVLLEDPSYFRGLVGALQYLTLTRPDLSYNVDYASKFMHAPTLVHLKMVRRILRYVKGKIDIEEEAQLLAKLHSSKPMHESSHMPNKMLTLYYDPSDHSKPIKATQYPATSGSQTFKQQYGLAFSTCHIYKILTVKQWGGNPNLSREFSEPSKPSWWTYYGPTIKILPKPILDGFELFRSSFNIPRELSAFPPLLFFFSNFGLAWIVQWDYIIITDESAAFPSLGRTFKTKWWDALKNDASTDAVKQYFLKNPSQVSASDDMSQFLLKKQQLQAMLAAAKTPQEFQKILDEGSSSFLPRKFLCRV